MHASLTAIKSDQPSSPAGHELLKINAVSRARAEATQENEIVRGVNIY